MTISKNPIRYMDYQYVPIHQVFDENNNVIYEGTLIQCKLFECENKRKNKG